MNLSDPETNDLAFKTRFRLRHLLAFMACICVIVACLRTPFLQARNNHGHSDWPRASPFTRVDLTNDVAQVEFDGEQYELVSINGKSTKQILTSARRRYGSSLGDKRFIEDLPAVLGGLGLSPDATDVDLVLTDSAGTTIEVKDAPMTAANRSLVYQTSSRPRPIEPFGAGNILFLVCAFVAMFGRIPSRVIAAILAFRSKRTSQENVPTQQVPNGPQ